MLLFVADDQLMRKPKFSKIHFNSCSVTTPFHKQSSRHITNAKLLKRYQFKFILFFTIL